VDEYEERELTSLSGYETTSDGDLNWKFLMGLSNNGLWIDIAAINLLLLARGVKCYRHDVIPADAPQQALKF
jgi:hypothetical protein